MQLDVAVVVAVVVVVVGDVDTVWIVDKQQQQRRLYRK
jgi:hypothetical protein